jgi:hypothetical protein
MRLHATIFAEDMNLTSLELTALLLYFLDTASISKPLLEEYIGRAIINFRLRAERDTRKIPWNEQIFVKRKV